MTQAYARPPRRRSATRSYQSWFGRERELRAFVRFGLAFGEEGLQRRWDEIERRPWDGSSETVEIFDDELEGLGQLEFDWMLLAAGVKDAVTLYEVYLEQAFDEILLRHGAVRKRKDSPRWPELREYYMLLGIDLSEDARVTGVRRLRHLLTHRRGTLETEADEEAFGATYPFPAATVELTADRVSTAMAALAASVEVIEPVAYEYSWGSGRIEGLVIGESSD